MLSDLLDVATTEMERCCTTRDRNNGANMLCSC